MTWAFAFFGFRWRISSLRRPAVFEVLCDDQLMWRLTRLAPCVTTKRERTTCRNFHGRMTWDWQEVLKIMIIISHIVAYQRQFIFNGQFQTIARVLYKGFLSAGKNVSSWTEQQAHSEKKWLELNKKVTFEKKSVTFWIIYKCIIA